MNTLTQVLLAGVVLNLVVSMTTMYIDYRRGEDLTLDTLLKGICYSLIPYMLSVVCVIVTLGPYLVMRKDRVIVKGRRKTKSAANVSDAREVHSD